MTITQLRYFMAVADQLSFTRAAKELLISQSNLSQHIAKLEAELGVTLFERDPAGLALTAEGRYLRSSAEMLLDELDTLPQSLQQIQRMSREAVIPEEFSIGVDCAAFSMDPAMTAKFVSAVQALSEKYPHTRLNISEIASNAMFPQLLDGTLHVTVGGFHYPRSIRIHSIRISLQQLNLAVKDDPSWNKSLPVQERIAEILSKMDLYTVNFDETQILKTQTWLDKAGGNQVLKFAKHSGSCCSAPSRQRGRHCARQPFRLRLQHEGPAYLPHRRAIHFPLRLVARGQHPSAAQGICGNAAITFFLL